MDKVQKPCKSECYTPSSEPFRIYRRERERKKYKKKGQEKERTVGKKKETKAGKEERKD
jgi:hypothetical protein